MKALILSIILIGSTTYVNTRADVLVQTGDVIEDVVTWRNNVKTKEVAEKKRVEEQKQRTMCQVKQALQMERSKPVNKEKAEKVEKVEVKPVKMKTALPYRQTRNKTGQLSESKQFGRNGCNTKHILPYVETMEREKYNRYEDYNTGKDDTVTSRKTIIYSVK